MNKSKLSKTTIQYNHVQVVPFSKEEKEIVTVASRLSETRRPVFFKRAILSYCEHIITDHQASLTPVSPSPDQEVGEASLSNDK
ncbi:hypothetical protein SDC9_109066 [bioreactor metagenome]|uniref:Uncharacterized protein n=1 Tax=bioreactor metagenome TaxID=1076179 RepID=A0A645B9P4_9ZZZZ